MKIEVIKFFINKIKQNGDTFVLKVKDHYEDYIVESGYNRWTYPNEESRYSDGVEMHFYCEGGEYDYIDIEDIVYVLSHKSHQCQMESSKKQKEEYEKTELLRLAELKKQQEEEYSSEMQMRAFHDYKQTQEENMWKN